MSCIIFEKLHEDAKIPKRGSRFSAGVDLCSVEDLIIKSQDRKVVKTGLAVRIPIDSYARIAPRSGLAVKNGIHVGAGVVDSDYRGEIGIVLFNHGNDNFVVSKGDRIAQLVVEKIYSNLTIIEGDVQNDVTERGSGGFGSTGTGTETECETPPIESTPKVAWRINVDDLAKEEECLG